MISRLCGTIEKESPSELTILVGGVGYQVSIPLDVWGNLTEGSETTLYISTYVREDRLDLFGFSDAASKNLFAKLIETPGIGPRTGLELCSVPRNLLLQAITEQDPQLLTNVKGIGKKTAEKLLLELKNVVEKQPELLGTSASIDSTSGSVDADAIEALRSLGYDTGTILQTLKEIPEELETTEERVSAALKSL